MFKFHQKREAEKQKLSVSMKDTILRNGHKKLYGIEKKVVQFVKGSKRLHEGDISIGNKKMTWYLADSEVKQRFFNRGVAHWVWNEHLANNGAVFQDQRFRFEERSDLRSWDKAKQYIIIRLWQKTDMVVVWMHKFICMVDMVTTGSYEVWLKNSIISAEVEEVKYSIKLWTWN